MARCGTCSGSGIIRLPDVNDEEWTDRHIALMRTQRGHECLVEGCTGSQPLMWVPTEAEMREPRGHAIDLPARVTHAFRQPRTLAARHDDHNHWAW